MQKACTAVRGLLTQGSAFAFLTVLELQRRDGIRAPIAEIGTFYGKSLVGFGLGSRPDEAVVGVDLFVSANEDFETALRMNWTNAGLAEPRLRLHRGSSTQIGAAG